MKIPYLAQTTGVIRDYAYRMKKGHLPRELIYFVTTRCGYRCKTCFYWQELNSGKNELSLQEIEKVSTSMGKMRKVLFSGGEPYIREDLPQICKIFHDQNNVRFFHIPTHGFNPNRIETLAEKILQNCPSATVHFGFSIDGLRKTHEEISQIPGSFDKVIESATRVSALKQKYSNAETHVICVVSNKNYDEVLPLSELLNDQVALDGFLPTPIRGEPLQPELHAPSRAEWLELTKKLEVHGSERNKKRFRFALDDYLAKARRHYFDKVTADIIATDKQPVRCVAGDTIGVMEPDGRIKLCELKLAIDVGNVRDVGYDFKKVWFSPKADDVRKKVKTCSCYHGCFLTPSLYYSPLHLVRSLFP